MNIRRWCKLKPLNWAILPSLPTRLEKMGFEPGDFKIEVDRTPDRLEFESIEEALADVRDRGIPERYTINLWIPKHNGHLRISREFDFLHLSMPGVTNPSQFEEIMQFLGLEPLPPQTKPAAEPTPPRRTAFIAHKFDSTGNSCADKLARFLELLGFRVTSGRGYSPRSVAAKVRERMAQQAIVFVLFTAGTDETWLAQESALALEKDKPIFVIKAENAEFKSAVLADHEYVPFSPPTIETAFIQILEGLRELGYRAG